MESLKLSQSSINSINSDMGKAEEEIIKNIPIRVIIDGMEIDIESEDRTGGEINLFLGTPLFCGENDKYYNLVEVKKEGI